MTIALPYLRSLRKSSLVSLAETSHLEGWEDYRKTDLEVALDEHLSSRKVQLRHHAKLAPYYHRLDNPRSLKRKPVASSSMAAEGMSAPPSASASASAIENSAISAGKRLVRNVSPSKAPGLGGMAAGFSPSFSPIIDPKRKRDPQGESTTAPRDLFPPKQLFQTPRTAYQTFSAARDSVFQKGAHRLRAFLSNMRTIRGLILLIEVSFLLSKITPIKRYPASIVYRSSSRFAPSFDLPVTFSVPQLNKILFDAPGLFWTPLVFWALVNLALPAIVGYFVNIGRTVAGQTNPYFTTRGLTVVAHERYPSIDPVVFDATRMLLAYFVYGDGFTCFGFWNRATVRMVNSFSPGCLKCVFAGGIIGVLGNLYEAILRR